MTVVEVVAAALAAAQLYGRNNQDASGGSRGGQYGDHITDPHPIARISLQTGENIRSVLRNSALPAVNCSIFYNRWHLGGHCFT